MQVQNHKKYNTWTQGERDLFMRLFKLYGRRFRLYIPHFQGRTELQIKSFYYNQLKSRRSARRDGDEGNGIEVYEYYDEE